MDEFLNILNNAHNNKNFTIKKENNDKLIFLDVQVQRKKKIFNFGVQKENIFRVLFKL